MLTSFFESRRALAEAILGARGFPRRPFLVGVFSSGWLGAEKAVIVVVVVIACKVIQWK